MASQKHYHGAMISTGNLNATIATSGIRNGRISNSSGGGGGGGGGTGSGIQVQQMYDSTTTIPLNGAANQKPFLSTFQKGSHNHSSYTNPNNVSNLTNTTGGGVNMIKSPSAESLTSTKSNMKQHSMNAMANMMNSSSISNPNPATSQTQQTGGLLNSSAQRRTSTNVMSAETAMKTYMSKLTAFEHHEIFNYSEIFFVGQSAKKIAGVIGGPNNNSYDDENGSYKPVQHDHILYRFLFFYFSLFISTIPKTILPEL